MTLGVGLGAGVCKVVRVVLCMRSALLVASEKVSLPIIELERASSSCRAAAQELLIIHVGV